VGGNRGRSRVDQLKAAGLTLFNMMFSGFLKAIYGRPGRRRHRESDPVHPSRREVRPARDGIQLLRAPHRGGLLRRAGPPWRGAHCFDYQCVKDPPPLPEEGANPIDEMWLTPPTFSRPWYRPPRRPECVWRFIRRGFCRRDRCTRTTVRRVGTRASLDRFGIRARQRRARPDGCGRQGGRV
jgi:hypothetical protein